MVRMSNWPPSVAMSVVTRWRSTFSSRTTQLTVWPDASSHCDERSCMMIMSPLFTVAIVISSAEAIDAAPAVPAIATASRDFIGFM